MQSSFELPIDDKGDRVFFDPRHFPINALTKVSGSEGRELHAWPEIIGLHRAKKDLLREEHKRDSDSTPSRRRRALSRYKSN